MPRIRRVTRRTCAETVWRPRRTQRLTPLAFATPCSQIYCENTGVRMLPYFQTGTLFHACHLLTEPPELPLDWAIVSYLLITLPLHCQHHICSSITLRKVIMFCFPQCNYAPHACLHQICTSITLRKAIMPRCPQCNYARTKISKKSYAQRVSRTTPATQTATSWLSTPHDWAIQVAELPLHRTELFQCELPFEYSSTWLS